MNISENASFMIGILEIIVTLGQHTFATFCQSASMNRGVQSIVVQYVIGIGENMITNVKQYLLIYLFFSQKLSNFQLPNLIFKLQHVNKRHGSKAMQIMN